MRPLALDLCCGIWEGGWANGLVKAGWQVIGIDIEDGGGYAGHKILADVREVAKDVEVYFPALKFDLVVASPPCQEFSYSSLPFVKARTKFTKENPPDPSIWNACVKIAKDLKAPLILENVSGARKRMGKHSWKYGSYYFWGDMPALIPIGNPRKGFGKVANSPDPMESRSNRGSINQHRDGKFGWNKPEVQNQRNKSPFATPSQRVDRIRPKNFMPGEYERQNPVAFKKMVGSEKYRGPEMSEQTDKYKMVAGSRNRPPHNLRKKWSAKVAMIPFELSHWIGQVYYPKTQPGLPL